MLQSHQSFQKKNRDGGGENVKKKEEEELGRVVIASQREQFAILQAT